MTKRLAGIFTIAATIAAVAGVVAGPARAQLVSDQPFASYGTGAAVSLNALQVGATQVADVQAAFAGQSTNSAGLGGQISNEMGYTVQPANLAGRSAYGRGAGLEVGVAVQLPDAQNQILLSGLAEAAAPPPTGPVVRQIGPVELGGLAYANVLRSRARATFDPSVCTIGRPMAFGEGEAAGLGLVGTASPGGLDNPLVGAALPPAADDPRNVSRSRSLSYLVPNGDGTFGLVSEVRQTVAPVSLLGGAATLELLGEWALRAIATGKPGGASIEYAPVGAGPETTVATLTIGGAIPLDLALQDLLGPDGLVLDIPLLATIAIGAPPRAIGGAGAPLATADGTQAAAAVDVARVNVLDLALLGLNALDLRIGHMEAAVTVPEGGIRCNIPVSKVADPNPVQAGSSTTITIQIPSDTAQFAQLFGCDLIGIRAQDVHGVESGNPSFVIQSASNGGVISDDGSTVTWENLGNVAVGGPPVVLEVVVFIPASSGTGVLRDTVDVVASLGNCQGGEDGQSIVGGVIDGIGVGNAISTGTVTLIGPQVGRGGGGGGALPPTGADASTLVAGGGLILGALALRRRLLS